MDAEKRHQLKQNELAEALTHVKDFGRDPATRTWLLVALLIVLGVVAYRVWGSVKASEVASQWKTISDTGAQAKDSPDDAISTLRGLLDKANNESIDTVARLRLAALLRDQASTNPAQADQYLKDSVDVLKPAVDRKSTPPQLRAAAAYSLATSYESRHDYAEARRMYQLLIDGDEFVGTPFKDAAASRLATLDELSEPVVFVPGEPPKADQVGPAAALAPRTPTASAPATQPAEAPAVAPAPTSPPAEGTPTETQPASGDAPAP